MSITHKTNKFIINDETRCILTTAHINPETVLDINKVNNICPWCGSSCGCLAQLYPCVHTICSCCLDCIIDSGGEKCPHCLEKFQNFKWKRNLYDK